MFSHEGWVYAHAMRPSPGGGLLLRSRDGLTAFEEGPAILPGCRHAATWVEGDTLHLFYSRKGDSPERILVAAVDLTGPWETWQPGPEELVLRPERDWEGAGAPVEPSRTARWPGSSTSCATPGSTRRTAASTCSTRAPASAPSASPGCTVPEQGELRIYWAV